MTENTCCQSLSAAIFKKCLGCVLNFSNKKEELTFSPLHTLFCELFNYTPKNPFNESALDILLPKYIEFGINIDFLTGDNSSILFNLDHTLVYTREREKCTTILRILIKYFKNKLNLNSYTTATPLHFAVSAGCFECAKLLLDNDADVNINNPNGCEIFYTALCCKDQRIAAYILKNANSFNFKMAEKYNYVPVFWLAVQYANLETMRALPSEHIRKYINSKHSCTLLMMAISIYKFYGNDVSFECIKYLLECGADPNMKDDDGKTAIEHASNVELIELLQNWQGLPSY